MPNQSYEESIREGIAHLLGNLKYEQQAVELLNNGSGNRRGCLGTLSMVAKSKSLLAWFVDRDLKTTSSGLTSQLNSIE